MVTSMMEMGVVLFALWSLDSFVRADLLLLLISVLPLSRSPSSLSLFQLTPESKSLSAISSTSLLSLSRILPSFQINSNRIPSSRPQCNHAQATSLPFNFLSTLRPPPNKAV